MKKAIYLLLISKLMLVASSTNSYAGNDRPDQRQLVKFSVIYNSGRTYLNWTVKNFREDGVFIVEKSVNGSAYKLIGLKNGIGSPHDLELLYSWVEENSGGIQGVKYRIRWVGENGDQELVGEWQLPLPPALASAF